MLQSVPEIRRELHEHGLMTRDESGAFLNELPATPTSAEEFAKLLVSAGHLTKYQARVVHQGHAAELVFDQYVLLKKIGSGGMGQVYLARHSRMKRDVAIKVLPPDAMEDESSIKRFQREVEAAAQLAHPNIVTSFDAGEANGKHYFVMEYVQGVDLETRVREWGPMPPDRAVECIRQAAEGLKYAHGRGIIHRDIKPANLLLAEDGTVKILDMGLARFDETKSIGEQAGLTNTGAIMGTVDYMSPEQALDTRAADARSDVYSLGCTLHFLLTGEPVYRGDTVMKRLLAHREAEVPSLTVEIVGRGQTGPSRDDSLNAVFQKMVAKDIAARLQNMSVVLAALETLDLPASEAAAGPISVRSVSDAGRTDEMRGSAVGTQRTADVKLADFHLNETLNTNYLNETVTLGAQSGTAAERRRRRTRRGLLVAAAAAGLILVIAGMILWSPWKSRTTDDRDTDNGPTAELTLPPVDGPPGLVRTYKFPKFGVSSCAILPDGTTAIVGCNDGMIRTLDLKNGSLTATIPSAHEHEVRDVAVTKDGRQILSASTDQMIKLWNRETGKLVRQYYGHTKKVTAAVFLPGEKRFVSASVDRSIRFWDVDESSPALTKMYEASELPGKPKSVADLKKLRAHLSWVRTVAVSKSGRFIVSGGNDALLMKWDPRTGELLKVLHGHSFVVANLAISPDEKTILSGGFDNRILLWNAETGEPIREFHGHVAPIFNVAYSRNSRRALSSSDDGTVRLWDVGTGKAIRVFSGHEGKVRRVSFFANDRFAVSAGEDNTIRLWRLPKPTVRKPAE